MSEFDITERQDQLEEELVESEKKAEQFYNRVLADLSSSLKTETGRNVIWWVLSLCRVYADEFSESEKQMYTALGARSIGIQIIEMLNHVDPAAYAELQLQKIKEGNKDA